jgi:hypothetical protein
VTLGGTGYRSGRRPARWDAAAVPVTYRFLAAPGSEENVWQEVTDRRGPPVRRVAFGPARRPVAPPHAGGLAGTVVSGRRSTGCTGFASGHRCHSPGCPCRRPAMTSMCAGRSGSPPRERRRPGGWSRRWATGGPTSTWPRPSPAEALRSASPVSAIRRRREPHLGGLPARPFRRPGARRTARLGAPSLPTPEVAEVPLDVILLPRLTHGAATIELRPLSRAAAVPAWPA